MVREGVHAVGLAGGPRVVAVVRLVAFRGASAEGVLLAGRMQGSREELGGPGEGLAEGLPWGAGPAVRGALACGAGPGGRSLAAWVACSSRAGDRPGAALGSGALWVGLARPAGGPETAAG